MNIAFARLIAQIIKLRAQFPYYDNTCDFKSKAFDDYYTSIKIGVKHLVAHTILNMI